MEDSKAMTTSFNSTGGITGFPKPHIRSGWKDPIGKLLTDRRIDQLTKKGFYGQSGIVAFQKQLTRAKVVKKKAHKQPKRRYAFI